jgi:hypothetical protein
MALLDVLQAPGHPLAEHADAAAALAELRTLFGFLAGMGALAPVTLDLSLARGLDYYTGVIYEAVLAGRSVGSIAAGGRRAEPSFFAWAVGKAWVAITRLVRLCEVSLCSTEGLRSMQQGMELERQRPSENHGICGLVCGLSGSRGGLWHCCRRYEQKIFAAQV